MSSECKVPKERLKIDDLFLDLVRARGGFIVAFNVVLWLAFILAYVLLKTIVSYTNVPSVVRNDEIQSMSIVLSVFIIIALFLAKFRVSELHLKLHIICYLNSDARQLLYIAIDKSTDKLMLVQKSKLIKGCAIKKTDINELKELVRNTGYYELIENITEETQGQLKDIQFGEHEYKKIWIVKTQEKDIIKMYGIWSTLENKHIIRYMSCPQKFFREKYGNIDNIRDLKDMFSKNKINFEKSENIKYLHKQLTKEDIELINEKVKPNKDKYNGNISLSGYARDNFIFEKELNSDDISVRDINIMALIEHMADGKKIEKFQSVSN